MRRASGAPTASSVVFGASAVGVRWGFDLVQEEQSRQAGGHGDRRGDPPPRQVLAVTEATDPVHHHVAVALGRASILSVPAVVGRPHQIVDTIGPRVGGCVAGGAGLVAAEALGDLTFGTIPVHGVPSSGARGSP